MNIKTLWLGIILFTGLMMGGVSVISAMLNDGSSITDQQIRDLNTSFVKYDKLNVELGKMESNINQTEATQETTQTSGSGTLSSLMLGTWNIFKNMGSSFIFFKDSVNSISDVYPNVPDWIVGLGVMAITVIIIFTIYGAIFQRDV